MSGLRGLGIVRLLVPPRGNLFFLFLFCSFQLPTRTLLTDWNEDTRSTLATLATLLDTGINILLWAGDADWICNWAGSEAVANAAIASRHGNSTGNDTFREQKFEPYTVRGVEKGLFKRDGNLTLMRVFEAGHEVGFYRGLN